MFTLDKIIDERYRYDGFSWIWLYGKDFVGVFAASSNIFCWIQPSKIAKYMELFPYVTPAEATCTGGTHNPLLLGLYPERWNEHPVHRQRSALSNTSLASPIFYLDLHTWLGNVRDLQVRTGNLEKNCSCMFIYL